MPPAIQCSRCRLWWSVAISWQHPDLHSETDDVMVLEALLSSGSVHGQSLEFSVHAQ